MDSCQAMDIAEQRQESRWVQIESASVITGLKLSRLRNLVHRHGIPFVKVGRSVFFDVHELAAWMERQKVVTVAEALDQRMTTTRASGEPESRGKSAVSE